MSETPRFPAEWEPQSAVLMAWPHAGTDWAERLAGSRACFAALASAICARQPVLLLVADDDTGDSAMTALSDAGCRTENLRLVRLPYDDTWLRDSGPITLRDGGGFLLLDFHFTAWGGKFGAVQDDRIVAGLAGLDLFRSISRRRVDFALEGGAIETDGEGTLLSTWHCLHARHPGRTRAEIESVLKASLHQERVLWLEHGHLEGDDTDAHIDTLARFASPEAIVYQGCRDPDDGHFAALQAMAAELRGLRRRNGEPYRLHELPWPRPILDAGRRLAASYANFLIINGAVLVPTYADPADAQALAVMGEAFPGRDIVGVPCRDLIWQNGSLHCCTMQLPEGLLK